jgi:quercetin dioxygenase-like cupin family protein
MTLPIDPELSRAHAEPSTFEPEPGLARRILANNSKLMLVEHRMAEGWVGARHSHPHDQLVYVISGHLQIACGAAERFEVKTGDSFVVRGGVQHQAWALLPSHVLDIFTPTREDYLPQPGGP